MNSSYSTIYNYLLILRNLMPFLFYLPWFYPLYKLHVKLFLHQGLQLYNNILPSFALLNVIHLLNILFNYFYTKDYNYTITSFPLLPY